MTVSVSESYFVSVSEFYLVSAPDILYGRLCYFYMILNCMGTQNSFYEFLPILRYFLRRSVHVLRPIVRRKNTTA